jgi:hypothetical protein
MINSNSNSEKNDMQKTTEEEYIRMANERIGMVLKIVCRNSSDPSAKEWEISRMIAEKMIDPFYYWQHEGPNELESENGKKNEVLISEIAEKYDLDLSEIKSSPSRIKIRKYIENGFEELKVKTKEMGYAYDRESRSFVKWIRK